MLAPQVNIASRAARQAGRILRRAADNLSAVQVQKKGLNDFVTEVDHASERIIIDILRKAYPQHSILGEESGLLEGSGEGKAWQWVIDPLDGTTNFIHGFPVYAISIALLHRGQPNQAVVFDPARNELFTASRGGGAFLNDRRIRVSGNGRYHEALVGEHIGRSTNGVQPESMFARMLADCGSVRRTGSTVLDMAYVAAGRLDGFCGINLKKWDVAASGLLVLEAGGLIGDFEGEQGWMKSGNVLAATPKIFAQMLNHLNN